MMSIGAGQDRPGSVGNHYTDKDNYYVLGSMGERWAGRGAEQLGLQGSVDKDVLPVFWSGQAAGRSGIQAACRMAVTGIVPATI